MIWENALLPSGAGPLLIAVIAQAFCGMASVTANPERFRLQPGRGGPGAQVLAPHQSPDADADKLHLVLRDFSFILAVPSLWSGGAAYAAVTSIATIGLYIAYVLPTLLRRMQGKSWQGGRWSSKWSPLVGWVGIIWVAFISVLFMLPEVPFSSVNHDNFNYAPIAVGVVLLFSGGYWLLSARKWSTDQRCRATRRS